MSIEKKILIVEDDEVVRNVFELILNTASYHVITAKNGEEGLEKIGSEHPDLILTDHHMPKKTGYEMLCEAKKCHGFIPPALLMSGKPKDYDLDYDGEIRNYGDLVSEFLFKPVNPSVLLKSIEYHLNSGQKIQ